MGTGKLTFLFSNILYYLIREKTQFTIMSGQQNTYLSAFDVINTCHILLSWLEAEEDSSESEHNEICSPLGAVANSERAPIIGQY